MELLGALKNNTAKIGIVGLGYVGLPLLREYVRAGFQVVGFDIDQNKIDSLKKGRSYIKHIEDEVIKTALDKGFIPTSDFSEASNVDALIICVPTPLNKYREPDLSYVIGTIESLLPHLRKYQAISLESTTYPGTTDEEIVTRLESKGFKVGDDFYVVYSPEREDPGRSNFTTKSIPKVVGGYTAMCLEIGLELYRGVVDTVVPVSSTRVAEMTKLLENIHRAVNIGLVNELKIVADKMGLDIYEIIDAAATKPFGFVPYYPGPGLGGHCIPIDPFYLTWKAREYGVHTRFIELAGEVNSSMPTYVIEKVFEGLNLHAKAIKGSTVLVLGLAYKKNVDDMRESPSVELMELLVSKGAKVAYSDPYIPSFPTLRKYEFDMESVELTEGNIAQYDCVILATDHDCFDYDFIVKHAKLIVDTRGKFRGEYENVVRS